jgi:uncharacterized protein (DUF983 family)
VAEAGEWTGLRGRWIFLRRAWRHRCPQCGEGALFRRYARLAEACSVCGLVFRRESGSQTGSMYLSAAVTEFFAALVALALFFATDWSTPVALSVGIAVVLAFSFTFLPKSMASWVAVEYATDVGNGESWAQPRAEKR